MAKENKNNQAQKPEVQDNDNLSKVVRNGNVPTIEMSKNVAAMIQKEKDERLAEKLKSKTLEAEFVRRRKLLQLRARRRESEITKEFLVKAEILQYQMAGFELTEERVAKLGGKDGKVELEIVSYDENGEPIREKKTFEVKKGQSEWVPASITITEFDELSAKNKEDEAKAKAKCDADLRKDMTELEQQYPGYFSYSWRW
jgi:hypothetical protein